MVLAIEPMVNVGGAAVKVLDDGWTAVTKDGSLSAHFEHTVAITSDGPLVLSQPFEFKVSKSSSATTNINRLVSVDGA
jgi:methionine aminopeptidase